MIDWQREAEVRKNDLMKDLIGILEIASIKDLSTATAERPMGDKIGEALEYMLKLSEEAGFTVKNVDGMAGHAELEGGGEGTIGILCHVDVVPAPGEWTTPPFEPEVRDGRLYARGSIDDKGPTLAAFYGLKMVRELGLELRKNVRIIFGTDEESGMSCMRHYAEAELMPEEGFAPDAVFPNINAEKGQMNVKLAIGTGRKEQGQERVLSLLSFQSGSRINMVPESASASVAGPDAGQLEKDFILFCDVNGVRGDVAITDDVATFNLHGTAAHGMEPFKGVNAGTLLAVFLADLEVQHTGAEFLSFLKLLHGDFYGHRLGISYKDEVSGPLTVNPGIISFDQAGESFVQLNIRCPVSSVYEDLKNRLEEAAESQGFNLEDYRESQPHYVAPGHPVIEALQKAYQEETGEEPVLLSTGGATYARFMKKGVAFGACFPGKEMTAHQKDEYIEVDDLVKAAAIYARAIYELAK